MRVPFRNCNCKKYLKCLHKAAIADVWLDCSKCNLRNDQSYKMTLYDFVGILSLRLYMEDRETYKKATETSFIYLDHPSDEKVYRLNCKEVLWN